MQFILSYSVLICDENDEPFVCARFSADADANPQTLLFSATCPPWVYDVAKKYMRPTCKHVDLIGKKTQKAATTVEVSLCLWVEEMVVVFVFVWPCACHVVRTAMCISPAREDIFLVLTDLEDLVCWLRLGLKFKVWLGFRMSIYLWWWWSRAGKCVLQMGVLRERRLCLCANMN